MGNHTVGVATPEMGSSPSSRGPSGLCKDPAEVPGSRGRRVQWAWHFRRVTVIFCVFWHLSTKLRFQSSLGTALEAGCPSTLQGNESWVVRATREGRGARGDSPSLATSPMGTLCFWAMYPRKAKTTKPEEKLVRELTEVVMIASLEDKMLRASMHHAGQLQFLVIAPN